MTTQVVRVKTSRLLKTSLTKAVTILQTKTAQHLLQRIHHLNQAHTNLRISISYGLYYLHLYLFTKSILFNKSILF